jgi:hypothetical protein
MTPVARSFTLTSNGGLLRALICDCQACAAFDPNAVPADLRPPFRTFKALWDTGATNSAITQEVVDQCGLKPTGMARVGGIHGVRLAETFDVNIGLPNGVAFVGVPVTLGQVDDAQMLIGMDIITAGDFSITNVGGRTVFSFRIPSIHTIDYAKQGPGPGPSPGGAHKQRSKRHKTFGKNKHRR